MTVISDYRSVPVLRDATFPDDVEAIVGDPANHRLEVVIGLTDVSDVVAFQRPHEGLVVAKAAVKLAGRLPRHTPEWSMAYARSFPVAASRFKGIGVPDKAEIMFSLAVDCLHKVPGKHPAESADYCRRVALFRKDYGPPDAALELSNRSRDYFERIGNTHGVGCALLCRGDVYASQKKFDRAADDFRSALPLVDGDLGFHHAYAASTNLANALLLGDGEEREIDDAIRQIQYVGQISPYKKGTAPSLTSEWTRARLEMKRRRWPAAQPELERVCAGWLALDLPLEFTIASLDLAQCYFEQGLRDEMVQLAGRVFPMLTRFRHDATAYRALNTFQQAALEDGMDVAVIDGAREAVGSAHVA